MTHPDFLLESAKPSGLLQKELGAGGPQFLHRVLPCWDGVRKLFGSHDLLPLQTGANAGTRGCSQLRERSETQLTLPVSGTARADR